MLDDKTLLRYLAALLIMELNANGKLTECPRDMIDAVNATRSEIAKLDEDDMPLEDTLRYALLGQRH